MSEEAMEEARRRNRPARLTVGDEAAIVGWIEDLERKVAALEAWVNQHGGGIDPEIATLEPNTGSGTKLHLNLDDGRAQP